jgi:hypothetical protein
MVNVDELRIGNLIRWNPKLVHPTSTLTPLLIEVAAIFPGRIGYTSPNFEHRVEPFEDDLLQTEFEYKTLKDIEPVPLTARVFESIRQVRGSVNEKNYRIGALEFDVTTNGIFLLNDHRKALKGTMPLQYLHQLQNLYYALTGETLEVNYDNG